MTMMMTIGLAAVLLSLSSASTNEGGPPPDQPANAGSCLLQVGSRQQARRPAPADAGGWRSVEMFVGSAPALGTSGTTHSQNNQDWFVSTLLSCKWGGYFVDLAANDAVHFSNTLMLERDYGWQGLCVEPNVDYYYGLTRRKCALVAAAIGSPTDSAVTFNMEGVHGGIVGFDQTTNKTSLARELRTVALGELLERFNAPATIDYMSLDVEGAESLVMDGFPWSKFRFLVLSVERPKADLKRTLIHWGYTNMNIGCVYGDQIWIHNSLPEHESMRAQWANVDAIGDFDESKSCMHAAGFERHVVRGRDPQWSPE